MLSRAGILAGVLALGLAVAAGGQAKPADLVDLNQATAAELMTVRGMTATWAGRIVRFRPYRSKADLVARGVVTPEVYARIRDGIVAHRVENAPTGKRQKTKGGQDSY
jgi:hypothetical protein